MKLESKGALAENRANEETEKQESTSNIQWLSELSLHGNGDSEERQSGRKTEKQRGN